MVKCSEVLQCSDDLSNKVSNIIRRHTDNMKFLFNYSLGYIFYQYIYIYMLYNCLMLYFMYFIIMYMYSYCTFMYVHRASWYSPATLTEVSPCFFISCRANARV